MEIEHKATRDFILGQLQKTSSEIASKFDNKYDTFLSELGDEIATSFNILHGVINREEKNQLKDNDFQAALIYWTGLNTYIAALELFRRGYLIEPLMLIRNILEIYSAALDIHLNPTKLKILLHTPARFNSTKSISLAKKVQPLIGNMYGMLSDSVTHFSILHTVPNASSTPLCIGGMFDSEGQKYKKLTKPCFLLVLNIMNSLLELTFFNEVSEHRFWKKVDLNTYRFNPIDRIKEQHRLLTKEMEPLLAENLNPL
ncbi:MAG: hypothetical protein A2550_03355 [Candidatus Jacksonbacteria bacterium RIFOXYD2_FULL_43_21]|nr:MAG: hypothetical protein A2240_00895 [Candidatus Jacksonbacteria bacterium RIFOXYA2_FULL_43_12]OGY78040.1 MAG: hypothetical protein A2550_03355 [Candidatus Jacksonbacteria bacterium RIFOXYD2_FULL_43_21]HCC50170.1 hypothetical protein [Candidatus Jacksonbacteria bacterium]